MVLWKFTLREIKSRPGRATLTLLSIVISVAAVVAVTVSKNTTHQAYKDMYESVSRPGGVRSRCRSGSVFRCPHYQNLGEGRTALKRLFR